MKSFLSTLKQLSVVSSVLFAFVGAMGKAEAAVTLDPRTGFQIIRESDRNSDQLINWINRVDCYDSADKRIASPSAAKEEADDPQSTWIQIFPQVTGWKTNDRLDVYISRSEDCVKEIENSTGVPKCAQVYSQSSFVVGTPLMVNPRDVVALNPQDNFSFDTIAGGGEEICETQEEESLVLFVIHRRSDGIEGSAKWDMSGFDLRGPRAPNALKAGPGDQHIFLEWELAPEDENDGADGFTYYCAPAAAPGAATDMSTAVGGAGGAGGNPDCVQSELVEGTIPQGDTLMLECGSIFGRTTREGQASGLVNLTDYAVAVSAHDALGNAGPLSPVECARPQTVTTFYESYKESGGQGGGGCAHHDSKDSPLLPGLFAISLVLFLWRRKENT